MGSSPSIPRTPRWSAKLTSSPLAGDAGKPGRTSGGPAPLTGPAGAAALIDQLRADGTVLTYDPASRTLRADGHDAPPVTIGTAAAETHSRQHRERRTG
jgi:hypothetical protein